MLKPDETAFHNLSIFDMGGVVSRNPDVSPLIAERLGLSAQEFRRLAAPDLHEHVAGRITERVFWERFGAKRGRPVDEDLWGLYFTPRADHDVVSLIQGLKARGRVVCGTNTIQSHYDIHRRQGDYTCFDAVYASHQMGLVKPEAEFWLHILRAEGTAPSDAIFVDDMAENVEGARQLGIRAHRFTDAAALEAWLSP